MHNVGSTNPDKLTNKRMLPNILLESLCYTVDIYVAYTFISIWHCRSGLSLAAVMEAASACQRAIYVETREKTVRYMVSQIDSYLMTQRSYKVKTKNYGSLYWEYHFGHHFVWNSVRNDVRKCERDGLTKWQLSQIASCTFGASTSFAPGNEYYLDEIIIPGHISYQTSQCTGLCWKTLKKC